MNPSSSVESATHPSSDDLYLDLFKYVGGEPDAKRQKQSESEEEEYDFEGEPPSIEDMSSDSEDEKAFLLGRTKEEASKMWRKYSSQIKESGVT